MSGPRPKPRPGARETKAVAFLSHYKAEAATDARYLYDLLRKMLRAPIYLDSSSLIDLRQLFTEGIHQSDSVLPYPRSQVICPSWSIVDPS